MFHYLPLEAWKDQVSSRTRARSAWLWKHNRVAELADDDDTVYAIVLDDHRYYAEVTIEEDEDDDDDDGLFWDPEDDEDDEDGYEDDDEDFEDDEDDEDEDEDEDEDGEDDDDLPAFSYWCSCGADDICPHVGALLYAMDDMVDIPEDHSIDFEEPEPDWNSMLSNMKRADLRNLLSDLVASNPEVREQLYLYRNREPLPGQEARWHVHLDRILNEYMVEDCNPVDDECFDLAAEVEGYLNRNIEILLKNGLLMKAFRLVCIAYDRVWDHLTCELDLDGDDEYDEYEDEYDEEDSIWDKSAGLLDGEDDEEEEEEEDDSAEDGEENSAPSGSGVPLCFEPVQAVCFDAWMSLIARASGSERDTMFRWLMDNLSRYRYTCLPVLSSPAWSGEQLSAVLSVVRDLLTSSEFTSIPFALQIQILRGASEVFLATKLTPEQVAELLRNLTPFDASQQFIWILTVSRAQPGASLLLMNACKLMAKDDPINLTSLHMYCASFYLLMGENGKCRDELVSALFGIRGIPADRAIAIARQVKLLTDDAEWPALQMKILNHPNLRSIREDLQEQFS